jgi:hypothetical protein
VSFFSKDARVIITVVFLADSITVKGTRLSPALAAALNDKVGIYALKVYY